MKKPADELEKLYQDKLRDHEEPVSDSVWERVEERVARSGKRRKWIFWCFLGLLLVGGLALGIGEFWPEEDEQIADNVELEQEGKDGSSGNEVEEKEGMKGKEEASMEATSGEGRKGKEDEEGQALSSEEEESQERGQASSDGSSLSREATGGGGRAEKDPATGEELGEDAKPSGEEDLEAQRKNEEEAEKKERRVQEKIEKEDGTVGEDMKEGKNKERTAKEEKAENTEEVGLPLMEKQVPDAGPFAGDSLSPLGEQPEKIELSKGQQPIDHFFVAASGSYGMGFRELSPTGSPSLVDFREQNEAPVPSWNYGIRSGAVWGNGLGFSLGLESVSYGNSYSYEDSRTLHDTTYSAETHYDYIDSTYTQFNPNDSSWDTITVVVDSTPYQVNDTTVNSIDSSYTQEFRTRYRYFTVPLTVSYEIGIGERFFIVPEVGLGLNFLVRSHVGWSEPESHEEVRMQYPSEDPFRPFALSYRGSLHFRYRFADSWEVGAGFRYSRFLHSVYTEEMPFEERPYRYGGVFELTYLLGKKK